MQTRTDLRNIAIIAHVDHGKTTLVDGLLQQAQVFRSNQKMTKRVMDSNDLERERGITILSKNTAVTIKDKQGNPVKINIIDTPGHADFGGEVERVLNMVDGVLLLVDAAEGPMPQTRFVLGKALALGHRVIVVINKIDRKDARPDEVLDETFDLFVELGATDEQADFPVVYAIGLEQKAGFDTDLSPDLKPMFDTILNEIPAPNVDVDAPLQFLATTLGYDQFRGVTVIGRIFNGKIAVKQSVARLTLEDENVAEKIQYLYVQDGLEKVEVETAQAGDIVTIAGLSGIQIGETLADPTNPVALPAIKVDDPTVRMTFRVNDSPFAGQEGKFVTSRQIRKRLFDELKTNVALKVEETDAADRFTVLGRGELHLAILIETMRREGYELQVSAPEVVFRENEEGVKEEPFEEVHIEVPPESVGSVIEMLGKRKGEMVNMQDTSTGHTHLTWIVPTRGLLGFRYQFLTATRGMGIMNTIFHGYMPIIRTEFESRTKGSLVAREQGEATSYGCQNAEIRGTLFIVPAVPVYEGMIVGEHQRPGDLGVNVAKKKAHDNMRKAFKDIDSGLAPARIMSLDESIEYLTDDDLLEVTPDSLRLRKRTLNTALREREAKRRKATLSSE